MNELTEVECLRGLKGLNVLNREGLELLCGLKPTTQRWNNEI